MSDDSAGSRATILPTQGDSEALADLVKQATAAGLTSVSITYRVNRGQPQSWASTYHAQAGWEILGSGAAKAAERLTKSLVSVERDNWGQIEVDVASGIAKLSAVQWEQESDVATSDLT